MKTVIIANLITGLANVARFCVISSDIARTLLRRKEAQKAEAEQLHEPVANSTQSPGKVEPILEQRVKQVESDLAVFTRLFGAVAIAAAIVVGLRMMGKK